MNSSLTSAAVHKAVHQRNAVTGIGYGGDAIETLTVLNDDLPCRVEWREGVGSNWDVWVFEEDADIQHLDILTVSFDDKLELDLLVDRVMPFSDLGGVFHHYEVTTSEHPGEV